MKNKYLEYLEGKLKDATDRCTEAQENAAKEIKEMPWYTARDYGAGYASHVENITKYAAQMEAWCEAIRAYKNMEGIA